MAAGITAIAAIARGTPNRDIRAIPNTPKLAAASRNSTVQTFFF
jgi:hypothetical protein